MLNPAVVEKQLVDISLQGGLNEKTRAETVDWTKWLTVAKNVAYDDGNCLIRRPGCTEYLSCASTSYAVQNLFRIKDGLAVAHVNKAGTFGTGEFSEFAVVDESTPRLSGANLLPEFSIERRVAVSGSLADRFSNTFQANTLVASCTSSDYNILIHQEPASDTNATVFIIVVTDRKSGIVIRRWTYTPSAVSPATHMVAAVYESGATKNLILVRDHVSGHLSGFTIINIAPASLAASGPISPSFTALTTPAADPGNDPLPVGVVVIGTNYYIVTGYTGASGYIARVTTAGVISAEATIAADIHGVSTDGSKIVLSGVNAVPNYVAYVITPSTLATYDTFSLLAAPAASTPTTGPKIRVACIPTSSGTDGSFVVVKYASATFLTNFIIPNLNFQFASYNGAGGTLGGSATLTGFCEVTQPFYCTESNTMCVTLAKQISAGVGTSLSLDTIAGSVSVVSVMFNGDGTLTVKPRASCIVDQYVATISENHDNLGWFATTGSGASKTVCSAPFVDSRYVIPLTNKNATESFSYEQIQLKLMEQRPVSLADDVISGGVCGTFSGRVFSEFGIIDTPSVFVADSGGGTGVNAGVHSYVSVYEHRDADGRVTYSRTSRPSTLTLSVARDVTVSATGSLGVSLRKEIGALASDGWSQVVYRTTAGGTVYYRLASFPLGKAGGASYTDNVSDATLITKPVLFRNPGTPGTPLDRYSSLASKHAIRHKDRVFYCNGTNIYYSSFTVDGEGAWFNPSFFIPVIGGTGDVTALASMDGILVVFKKDSVFLVDGDGPPENGGTGTEFSPPRRINTEFGCIDAKSVVATPDGIAYRSERGLELLTRSFQVSPHFGESVKNTVSANKYTSSACYDSVSGRIMWVIGSTLDANGTAMGHGGSLPLNTLSNGKMVVYDSSAKAWSVWESADGFVCVSNATLHIDGEDKTRTVVVLRWEDPNVPDDFYHSICYLNDTNKTDDGIFIPMTIETGCCRTDSLQARSQITDLLFLAKKQSGVLQDNHRVRISAAYDYSDTFENVRTFEPGLSIADTVEQYCYNVGKPNSQSVRFRIEILEPTGPEQAGDCLGPQILGLTVRLGKRGGEAKVSPDKNA